MNRKIATPRILLAGAVASAFLGVTVTAQTSARTLKPAAKHTGSRYRPEASRRANLYYNLIWGIDSLSVKRMESGELVRFTYRVLDGNKAKQLNDEKKIPSLIDLRAGVQLVVPELDMVGQLRQRTTPIPGKTYWIAFSNKGGVVKSGDRVNVIVGNFRADGLLVE